MEKNYIKPKNKCFIYKNDLKFNDNFDMEISEFISNDNNDNNDINANTIINIENMYNNFKNKPKIELRLEDSRMENYNYLDLSSLGINDEYFNELLKLQKITKILSKIEFLDLANNNLTLMPNLMNFPNILHLNISSNNISNKIENNNLIELTCSENNISEIVSESLQRLNANKNKLTNINLPNIRTLIINNNKLTRIDSYLHLKYLECIENSIEKISNMIELEELYVGFNNLSKLSNMPKLEILNCVSNPINKIKFFPKLKVLLTSNPNISIEYQVSNISKHKSDFIINFN